MKKTSINIELTINHGEKLPNISDPIRATIHKPTPFEVEGVIRKIKSLKWSNKGKLIVVVVVEANNIDPINNIVVVK